jgi:hypothetical protein
MPLEAYANAGRAPQIGSVNPRELAQHNDGLIRDPVLANRFEAKTNLKCDSSVDCRRLTKGRR